MNYYQSLNINNKIFFLKYQICKLDKIYDNYYNDWKNYIEDADDPEWDMSQLYDDEIIKETEKKMERVVILLTQKQLKLKLTKKYYE